MNYAIIAWGGAGKIYMKALENIQKSIIKIIFDKNRRYPTEQLFIETKLLDIRQIYCYNMLIHQFHNNTTNEAAEHNHNTRIKTKKNLRTLRMQKAIGQKFFEYLSPKLFNMLPVEYKECKNFMKYKRIIKKWLTDQGRSLFGKL